MAPGWESDSSGAFERSFDDDEEEETDADADTDMASGAQPAVAVAAAAAGAGAGVGPASPRGSVATYNTNDLLSSLSLFLRVTHYSHSRLLWPLRFVPTLHSLRQFAHTTIRSYKSED